MGDLAWITWVGWALVGLGTLGVLLWLARRSRKGSRLCPTCDYDLIATAGLACPECGKTARSERALGRRRRKGVWGRLGLAMVALGAGALLFNPGRSDGWASSVPDWVIWPMMPLVDSYADGWLSAYEAARMAIPAPAITPETRRPRRWERLLATRKYIREVGAAAQSATDADALALAIDGARGKRRISRILGSGGELGVSGQRVADDLLAIVDGASTAASRKGVLFELRELGPFNAHTVDRLRVMLNDSDPTLWSIAFGLLRRGAPDARLPTSEILVGLERVPPEDRADLLRDLYDMAPLEAAVLTKVAMMQSNDPDQMVRARAGAVIWRSEALLKQQK